MSCRLAVIIPMLNEEAGAKACIDSVLSALKEASLGEARLFVINDGSSDRTAQILGSFDPRLNALTIIHHTQNQGYGAAIATAAKAARSAGFEFGLVMDSDLTNDPRLIPTFTRTLSTGRYDLVKASRYIKGGGMKGVPAWRMAFTVLGNQFAYRLFRMGVRDCTNGFRAFRLSLVADLEFKERGFAQILEELYYLKKKGARATEVPTVLTARQTDQGASKFSYRPKVLAHYLLWCLKAAVIAYPEAKRDSIHG